MIVKFTIHGLEQVTAYIKSLPRGVKITAMRALATYILGDRNHGLRHEPAYTYVTRKEAYGETFSSLAQQRWFWANGGPDMIGNNRSHDISEGWTMKETDSSWTHVTISNAAEGVAWVMGDRQAAQPAMVGWRKWRDVVASNMAGGMAAARRAVAAWLSS